MVSVSESYLPTVTGVAVMGERVLRLLFSDGTVGDVDFSAEQWTGVLEPLNDPGYFAQVDSRFSTQDQISSTTSYAAGRRGCLPAGSAPDGCRNILIERRVDNRAHDISCCCRVGPGP